MPKFYSGVDFSGLELVNPRIFTESEIAELFDVTPQEAQIYASLLDDLHISQGKIYSSYRTEERLTETLTEANEFAESLVAELNTLKKEIVTSTDDMTDSNTLYLMLTDVTTNTYMQYLLLGDPATPTAIGDTQVDLSNYVTKDELSTTLSDYSKSTESVLQSDLTTTIDNSSTNDKVPTALATKIELDKKVDKTQITTTIDSTSTDDTIASAKSIYDFVGSLNSITGDVEYAEFYLKNIYTMVQGEYVPFELKRGNINITDGKFELKANKTYSIIMTTRPNDLDDATSPYSLYSVELVNINDLTLYPLIVTFHDFKGGRGEVPTSSTTITPSSNITVGARIGNTLGDYTQLMQNQTKIVVTEIPTPTSIMNVTDDHIKSVVSEDLGKKVDKTSVTTSFSSASTDTQVFSAKTIYNILNSKLSAAIKNATDLDETLTPGYYQLAGSDTANNVYTNCWGILHVVTNNASPTESWFWIWQIVYDNSKNKIFYRRKVTTNPWGAWTEICMTKVADVPLTSITPTYPSSINVSSNNIQYAVKNGIASVNIIVQASSITSTIPWTVIYSGLPKPITGKNIVVYPEGGAMCALGFQINTNGDLKLLAKSTNSTSDWWCGNFTYPVAD